MEYKCENAQFITKGIYEKVLCKKTNNICPFVYYCTIDRCLKNSEGAEYCLENPNRNTERD